MASLATVVLPTLELVDDDLLAAAVLFDFGLDLGTLAGGGARRHAQKTCRIG